MNNLYIIELYMEYIQGPNIVPYSYSLNFL